MRLRDQHVVVQCDPGPYQPRKSVRREGALLREFARRTGDPNKGGQTRVGLMTAYRQDVLRVAAFLADHGDCKGAQVVAGTGVAPATRMMADNHYGWFERVERGVYRLTPAGVSALQDAAPTSVG